MTLGLLMRVKLLRKPDGKPFYGNARYVSHSDGSACLYENTQRYFGPLMLIEDGTVYRAWDEYSAVPIRHAVLFLKMFRPELADWRAMGFASEREWWEHFPYRALV